MVYIFVLLTIFFLLFYNIRVNSELKDDFLNKNQTVMLKGWCALYIIFFHISQFTCNLSRIFTPINYTSFIIVGFFFFLSGYGLMSGLLKNQNYLNNFLKKRLFNIIIPYLIVINIYYIVISIHNSQNIGSSYLTFIYNIIFAKQIGALWYMNIIIVLYLAFYFVFRKLNIKSGIRKILYLTIFYIIVMVFLNVPAKWFSSIIGFWFGLYYKYNDKKILLFFKEKYKLKLLFFSMSFIFLFCIRLIISYLGFNYEIFHGIFRNIICMFFIIFITMLLMKIKVGNILLNFFGSISFEMYLFHPLFVYILRSKIFMNSFNIIKIYLLTIICSLILNRSYKYIKHRIGSIV